MLFRSDDDGEPASEAALLQNAAARTSHLDVQSLVSDSSTLHAEDEDEHKEGGGLEAKAGIILGIHNVFIVIPQFIMTGIASIIFALLDSGKAALSAVTDPANANATAANLQDMGGDLSDRGEALVSGGGSNSYAIIYR